jgi:hypothetical protein
MKLIEIALANQTGKSDQSTDAARRIGAARKSKEKDFVTIAVVRTDERIGIAEVARQARAGCRTDNLADRSAHRPDARLIVHDLRDPLRINGLDRPCKPRNVRIVGALVRVVPRAVAADHKPLHLCLPVMPCGQPLYPKLLAGT